jgi:phospholipase/carboxylesterase
MTILFKTEVRDPSILHAMPNVLTRRDALRSMAAAAAALAGTACNLDASQSSIGSGRLRVRPSAPTSTITPGLRQLGLGAARDGLLYVPTGYKADTPAPMALLFHGAGQASNELVDPMKSLADTTGLVLVAPDSRGATWDAIRTGFGPDTTFIEAALTSVFGRVNIDPTRVHAAGFSDGASYSLSLGLINGDFFTRVAAFSPGLIIAPTTVGKPKVFVTHGRQDSILPIDAASRRLVPSLRDAGYDVEYHEFDGGHGITPDLLRIATEWLAV